MFIWKLFEVLVDRSLFFFEDKTGSSELHNSGNFYVNFQMTSLKYHTFFGIIIELFD